ncbi:MAG: GNAT family N-acetyltransferase [Candidatus Saccharimonadales bacterium]
MNGDPENLSILRQKSFNPERQVYEYDILDSEGKRVGMAQLRLIPSKSAEMPEGFKSHVYYEVDTEYRGIGYATDALKKLLRKAKNYNVNPVVATVNASNTASIKVIENCGGQLVANSQTSTGSPILKYHLTP